MSKLTAFLSKSKKKGVSAEKAAQPVLMEPAHAADAHAPPPTPAAADTAVGGSSATSDVIVVDVVQPKALEQWRVDEDDVTEEGGAVVEGPALRGTREEDEEDDGEVDLPSSKVKGNFEWKRKTEDSTKPEEAAAVPAEDQEGDFVGMRRRRKDMDLENPETFPNLVREEQPAAASGSVAQASAPQKKQKPRGQIAPASSFEAKEDDAVGAAAVYSDVQKILTGDDIWTVLGGKRTLKWPRIALDEAGTRNRLQKSQILRAPC